MTSSQDPWAISKDAFPRDGSASAQLRFCLNYAILAPSSHNAQPWRFKLYDETVEIYADRSRSLPISDPKDRELIISCGSALFFLRVALCYFRWTSEFELLPDPQQPDLLARVRLGQHNTPCSAYAALLDAIPKRRTTRLPFESRLLPSSLLDTLEAAVDEEQGWVHVVNNKERAPIAQLIMEGDRLQMADKSFRKELATWIHSRRSNNHDGIPGYNVGMPSLLNLASVGYALAVRTFDMGNGVAASHEKLVTGSPALLVLGTDEDTPTAWLNIGQALASVLLWTSADGVTTSYLNQPCEVEKLREKLRQTIGHKGFPQLLLRLGYGPTVPPTPRRGLKEVLEE